MGIAMKLSIETLIVCVSLTVSPALSGPNHPSLYTPGSFTRPAPIPGHPHSAAGFYPEHAIVCDQQGKVLLDLAVGSDGRVKSSKLVTPSGQPDLDNAAALAVKTWIYQPATENGKPVAAHTVVAVVFRNQPPASTMERVAHYIMSLTCPFVDSLQHRT